MSDKENFVAAITALKPRILALAPGKKPDLALRRTHCGYEARLSWVERGNGHPQTCCVSQVLSDAFLQTCRDFDEDVLEALGARVADLRTTAL